MSITSIDVRPVEGQLLRIELGNEGHMAHVNEVQIAQVNEVQVAQVEDDFMATSSKILDIIYRYRLTKGPDANDKWSQGTTKFLAVINRFVKTGQTLKMCLPAFPFKSANRTFKVLGTLPDKAEETSLDRLNYLCAEIGEVYKPGAKLLIISDGLVYNGKCSFHLLLEKDCFADPLDLVQTSLPYRTKTFGHMGRNFVPLLRRDVNTLNFLASKTWSL